jgi:hypothetical protein
MCALSGLLPIAQPTASATDIPPGLTLVSSPNGVSAASMAAESAEANSSGAVTFISKASNLPGANGYVQVYLWTLDDGVKLISSPDGGITGISANATTPKIGEDGSVVFASAANNLPGYYSGSVNQLYRWTEADGVKLISSPDGTYGASSTASDPHISDNGSVVFVCSASNMPGAVVNKQQVYLWQPDNPNAVKLISSPDGGITGASSASYEPQINADDSIVFATEAGNMPGAQPNAEQVYLWTSDNRLQLLSSIDGGTTGGNNDSNKPDINDSGAVVFSSRASDLPGANGVIQQVYLWTEDDGLQIISADGNGLGGTSPSEYAKINSQGHITFNSRATEFLPGNSAPQVYFWTPEDGITLVTTFDGGLTGTSYGVRSPYINDSDDVLFVSGSSDMTGGTGWSQVWVWNPSTGLTLVSSPNGDANGSSGNCDAYSISSSDLIAFTCSGSNMPSNYGQNQVYAWRAASRDATLSDSTVGGIGVNSLGTPQATFNDANLVAGSVTLESTEATNVTFAATKSSSRATMRFAYTATDADPTAEFAATWTPRTVADGSYLWVEVTAEDGSVLIYKFAVTVNAPANPGNPGGPGNPGNPGGAGQQEMPEQLPWTGGYTLTTTSTATTAIATTSTATLLAGMLIMCCMVALTVVNRKVSHA